MITYFTSLLPSLESLGILGYWVILLISFAEAFVFTGWVVPGTVVVVIAGGLSAHGVYDFWDLVFFASVGAVIGDGISFELGHKGTSTLQKVTWFQRHVTRGKTFFQKYQTMSIAIGRFVGPVRPIIPFIAGLMDMNRTRFYVANIFSAIAWAIVYLGVGYLFGAAWKVVLLGFSKVLLIVLIPIVLFIFIVVLWRFVLRRGETILKVLLSILHSVVKGLQKNEYIGPWIDRHPRLTEFLQARISLKRFQGLPLTLLLFSAIYSFSVFSGIVEDYLMNDSIIAIDVRLANLFYAFRYEPLLHFFYGVTILANAVTIVSTAILLTILLWRQSRPIYTLVLWLTIFGSEGMAMLGKLLFHRARPSGVLPVLSESSYSFPSAHATSAVVLFGFLAYLLIREHRSWKMKVSAFFGAATAIFLVDLSRLYLGVHYLSDVLAGNALSFSVLLFAISVGEWMRSKKTTTSKRIVWKPFLTLPILGSLLIAVYAVFLPIEPKPLPENVPLESVSNVSDLFAKGKLPATTETLIGTKQEPVNLVLIVPDQCLISTLAKTGWIEADIHSLESTLKLAKAAIFNMEYKTAPMTPSFYDAQPHTIGFEKETEQKSVRSRHHVRFWSVPYRTDEGAIWVGSISLDTGIKWGITHSIAPDIDTERDLFVADLQTANVLRNEQLLQMVAPQLGKNFSGDNFFTDGKAALVTLRGCK